RLADNVDEWRDNNVQLLKAGSAVGSSYADTSTHYPTTETGVNYGGISDLWGTTWSQSDINNSNFGCQLNCTNLVTSPGHVLIDSVQLLVYYTPAAPAAPPYSCGLLLMGCG